MDCLARLARSQGTSKRVGQPLFVLYNGRDSSWEKTELEDQKEASIEESPGCCGGYRS